MSIGFEWTQSVFEPVKFIPASEEDIILAKTVETIQICAHAKNDTYPTPFGPVQNWVFHLVTGKDESIRIDMQPSVTAPATKLKGGSKGQIL